MRDAKTLIICSLIQCGYDDVELLNSLALSKKGYLTLAMKRLVGECITPNINELLEKGAEIAYQDLTGRNPDEELSYDINYQDSHVYLCVKHLDFHEVSGKFLEATGLELEEAYSCEDGEDIKVFQKFKDYLMNEVVPDLEVVKDDDGCLVVPDIASDFLLFLQREFDNFSEGEDIDEESLELIASYIAGGELDDFGEDSLWLAMYNKAVAGYKERLETKKTEDELNRTYR